MHIFLVHYRIKDGGHSDGDLVVGGGSYDLHKHVVITAVTSKAARDATRELTKQLHPSRACTVAVPIPLGDA